MSDDLIERVARAIHVEAQRMAKAGVDGDTCPDEYDQSALNWVRNRRDDLARAAIAALDRPATVEGQELARGKKEVCDLIESIWRAEFQTEAPNWKPLDDLPGMVSQLDNMYAGVRGQRDQARWDFNRLIQSAPNGLTD